MLQILLPSSDLVDYWRPGDRVHNGQITQVHPATMGSVGVHKTMPYPKTCLAVVYEIVAH